MLLQVVTVMPERVLVPEGFFNTSLLGSEAKSLPQLVSEAVNACDSDVRAALAREVILSGGPCMLPGMATRLDMELQRRLVGLDVKVRGYESGLWPSPWRGGAMFAELGGFCDMWISRDEYDEHGPSIVHKKCDIV
jgi:actin-related protein